MGCLLSQNQPITAKSNGSEIDEDLKFIVSSSTSLPSTYNDPIAILDNTTLNPLGYALWCGRLQTFKFLKEKKGASITQMELLFEKQNISGLEIIIHKGYLEMLKFYLPEYLLEAENKIDEIEALKKPLIQYAVSKGFIDIVKYLFFYFVDVEPPIAFNLHYVNPETGENSALIACKCFDLEMVKFLNETCKANFSVKNKKNQNALELVVNGLSYGLEISELFLYLIDHCDIDVSFKHQEIMEAAETIGLKDYYKNALENKKEKKNWEEQDTYLNSFMGKNFKVDESQMTIAAMSSISQIDVTNVFSVSVLQDERLYNN